MQEKDGGRSGNWSISMENQITSILNNQRHLQVHPMYDQPADILSSNSTLYFPCFKFLFSLIISLIKVNNGMCPHSWQDYKLLRCFTMQVYYYILYSAHNTKFGLWWDNDICTAFLTNCSWQYANRPISPHLICMHFSRGIGGMLQAQWGGGYLNTSVYTCATRKMQRKGCFLGLNLRITIRGQNVPVFKKKGTFLILLGAFRDHFSNSSIPKKRVPQKCCLGGKIGCETVQNSCLGMFFLIRANLY